MTFAPWVQNVAELRAQHQTPHRTLINGLLRERDVMSIVASPKVGKTFFSLQLALSVASGSSWLGRYATNPTQVLCVDNELHKPDIVWRYDKVRSSMGLGEDIDHNIDFASLRGQLIGLDQWILRMREIQPGTYGLVVIDSLYRILGDGVDENSNSNITQVFNKLDLIASYHGCAILVIHHLSKGDQKNKRTTDLGSGAGSQSRAVDTHLGLRSHKCPDAVTMEAAVRSWQPFDPVVLRRDFPLWKIQDDLDPEDLKGKKADITIEQFAAWLTTDPIKKTDLITTAMVDLDISRDTARKLIEELIDNGTATEERDGPCKLVRRTA